MATINIDLTPEEYHVPEQRRKALMRKAGLSADAAGTARIVHRTLDCRKRNIVYHCVVEVGPADSSATPSGGNSPLPITPTKQVIIVGAGPAGLFAALRALELGIKPVIVERGKPVEQRKYDIAALTREKRVNPDSNWCFGEGGAGTYSDGKLYTRSTKRGDVQAVLRTFCFGSSDFRGSRAETVFRRQLSGPDREKPCSGISHHEAADRAAAENNAGLYGSLQDHTRSAENSEQS